ncbi:MAG TPA: DUF411 domain-containing protein [Gemmatimonadales bacterium]
MTKDIPTFEDLAEIRAAHGIPESAAGCHTAEVDGFAVEGHVPADLINQMLRDRPAITGLAVPGMPQGSPGMDSDTPEPYTVLAIDREGRPTVYARR